MWLKLAWQTAHLMNASGNMKRAVTIDRLLGRNSGAPQTEKQKRAELKKLSAKFKRLREKQQAKKNG